MATTCKNTVIKYNRAPLWESDKIIRLALEPDEAQAHLSAMNTQYPEHMILDTRTCGERITFHLNLDPVGGVEIKYKCPECSYVPPPPGWPETVDELVLHFQELLDAGLVLHFQKPLEAENTETTGGT
jgi:hypothetical protein